MASKKKSLDEYLNVVFKEFVSIKDEDFNRSLNVFESVFKEVKQKMAEQCEYFKKNSKEVMYAGSVYDGSKITKMDEFDMDIVIRLPVNYNGNGENGIIIENEEPGYVKLKIINEERFIKQGNCYKFMQGWRDSEKYFLQSEFRKWLHSILQKAVNAMEGKMTVNKVEYLLTYSEAGPAYTLHIRNAIDNEQFKLDVDLVPVIRFMFPRVPEGYSTINEFQFKCKKWLVVPKPNKKMSEPLKSRCWRLSFHEQEREIMKDCKSMKMTYRLLKKLRDTLKMDDIASYYIKTLFLWKICEENYATKYWETKLSVLFQTMLKKLYTAIKKKNIPFFWNRSHNLIVDLRDTVQQVYVEKLRIVLAYITVNDPDKLVTYLLTEDELKIFRNTEFYKRHNIDSTSNIETMDYQPSELTLSEQMRVLSKENKRKGKQIEELVANIQNLDERVSKLEKLLSVGVEQ